MTAAWPLSYQIHTRICHSNLIRILCLCIEQWKFIYDTYGPEVLKKGIKDPNTGLSHGGYVYQQNCYEIFDTYFLKNNPFFDLIDLSDGNSMEYEGSLFGSAFAGHNQPKLPAMPTINITLKCTLKEFYQGCMKTVSYKKQVIGLDGKTIT